MSEGPRRDLLAHYKEQESPGPRGVQGASKLVALTTPAFVTCIRGPCFAALVTNNDSDALVLDPAS